MTRTRTTLFAALALTLVAPAGLAQAITLEMPFAAVPSVAKTQDLTSYALPIAAYSNGVLPTRIVEGALQQTAWRIDAPGVSTLELLMPLRAQLRQAGFQTVFECEAVACGGFDFRYGTMILPEPDMHVDLGDYRFFSAERGTEVVSLIVSRTAASGFVQMIHVGGQVNAAPLLTASSKAASGGQMVALTAPARPQTDAATSDTLGDRLLTGGAVALEDLVFASGSSALTEGPFASLAGLAGWLRDNPGLTVALVGHTDASGGLEGNIALSRKRAEAVRQHLIRAEGVAATQIEAQGVGYLSPRASNLTDEGRERNRRVEVMVTSTQVAP
ncbi:MAG: OmpA family protein [Pseudotabrizicola sp.]|uniref:OmpA family protein n=1 Tax=Pseudotabrizicola sp. TaxID=2939647 RepID=UPI00271CDC97|nr:OmpA family protein [Pseudotabrizicola sp.]MDO8881387.1 OmpA family protein [Pseudotabrizicola sp.]MDP2081806.1 OmpA family protein [Pseudotabrizicola sp.]MDZ7573904.1 OmpA family protein [Pseudotabrizicola sp.]